MANDRRASRKYWFIAEVAATGLGLVLWLLDRLVVARDGSRLLFWMGLLSFSFAVVISLAVTNRTSVYVGPASFKWRMTLLFGLLLFAVVSMNSRMESLISVVLVGVAGVAYLFYRILTDDVPRRDE